MSKKFTELEQEILRQVADFVKEVHWEMRKGVQQTKYVICIGQPDEPPEEQLSYYDYINSGEEVPVPDELLGYWITEFADDFSHVPYQDAIANESWVKCKKVEVVTHEWQTIDA